MSLFKLFLFSVFGAFVANATNAYACDDIVENGGTIFLRAAVVSYTSDHLMLNVQLSSEDFLQVNSLLPKCNLTVYIDYPKIVLKLRKASSTSIVGFEPRYARFAKVTSR